MKTALKSLIAVLILVGYGFAGPAPAAETILKVGSPWSAKTLDVQKSGYILMRLGIVEGLTDADDTLKIGPALATSWQVSADQKTWTFTLRPNVNFHDGTPLTAAIMADCLQKLMAKGSLLKNVPITGITATGPATLVITTSAPFAPLAAYLSRGEAGALAPSSFDAEGNVIKPVGTGLFAFASWKPNEEIVITANTAHWSGTRAKVDKVVYKTIPEALTRLAMLRSGDLDIAQIIPPDAAKTLAADPKFRLQSMPIGRCRIIGFNLARPPFDALAVRQAVNHAINRADLSKYVLEGFGDPAVTLFPPILFWANPQAQGYAFDPAKAKALLAKAGWTDSDKDGVLDKGGTPLAVKLVTYPERAELPPMAEVIQNQLAQVGIKVDIVSLQVDASNQMRNRGDFDMYLAGRGLFFVPDPDEVMMSDYFSENTFKDGWGAYHYRNARLDEIVLAARAAFDAGKRKALYDQAQQILLADTPVANLNYYVNVDLTAARVSGYRMHPNEQSFRLESVEIKQ